jgi:hypothetical protein
MLLGVVSPEAFLSRARARPRARKLARGQSEGWVRLRKTNPAES